MSYNINQTHFPSTQIYLNSKYADAYGGVGSMKSWCYFIFKEPIVRLPEAYNFLISLNSIELPCSMYAVNSNNNTINFSLSLRDDDGSTFSRSATFVAPPGNYTGPELAQLMNGLGIYVLGVFSFSMVVTYDEQNNKFVWSIPYSQYNDILFNQYNKSLISFTLNAGNQTCIFGLTGAELNATQTPDFIITSDAGVDLAGTRAVFVKCMNIHTPAYDSRTKYSGTTLARIPVMQEPFGIVFWSNHTAFKSVCTLKHITTLEIQITDEDGNLVDFNNIDWTMTLQLDVLNGSLTDYVPNIAFQ